MKYALLSILWLVSGASASPQNDGTWDRFQGATPDGKTKIFVTTFIHQTWERFYLLDYKISGAHQAEDRIEIQEKTVGSIAKLEKIPSHRLDGFWFAEREAGSPSQ